MTARSSTVPCTVPLTTRFTVPVFFSSTSMSPAPRKAIVVGRFRPWATGRTSSRGWSMTGPVVWAEVGDPAPAAMTSPAMAISPNIGRNIRVVPIASSSRARATATSGTANEIADHRRLGEGPLTRQSVDGRFVQ